MKAAVRKLFLWIGLAAAALAASVASVPPLLWGDHADYSRVASIRDAPHYQHAALLEKAWSLPVARLYRRHIEFQHNGSFCGPASIVNVLHSRLRPANQSDFLRGTNVFSVAGFIPGGLTLDELATLAGQKLGGNVTLLRDMNLAGFREQLGHVNDPSRRYLINFARGPLFGSGGGHHSPIAGYLLDEDLVLVLDVNEKFGPWLVKSARLFDAMDTIDPVSHRKRGMLLIE